MTRRGNIAKRYQRVFFGEYRKVLLTYLFVIFLFNAYSQERDSIRHSQTIKDGWIEPMRNMIGIDVSVNNSYETFEVSAPSNRFVLQPNMAANTRLKLNYKFISVGVQYAPDFIPGNGDEKIKGKTSGLAFGTLFIFKHWYLDLSYTQIKGYYLENTIDYMPWKEGDPYIQFPNLSYKGATISSGYIHNSKFSLRSLTSQTERQLKSAGSFIPAFDLRYYLIDDQSKGGTTQKSNNTEMSAGPGYAYTFVIKKKLYLSLALVGSVGYLNTKLTTRFPLEDEVTFQDNLILRWDGRIGVGYNGRRVYTGAYSSNSGTEYNQEKTTVVNTETRLFYHFFVGFRFNAPKFVELPATQLEDKYLKP